jgi:outer membrane receptor for ferrienterochelin and colicins
VVNLFTEDHAALTGSREVVVRESLRPEQSWNVNANAQRTFALSQGFLDIDASLFYTHFTNRIVADFTTNANQIIYQNLNGFAVSRGLTLNTEFNWRKNLRASFGLTLMDVFQQQKNDSTQKWQRVAQMQASPISGTFGISYTFPQHNFSIDWTGNFYSPMPLPVLPNDYRPSKSPWFSLQNIQLTKKFANGLSVYGGAKNLLNFIPKNPLMRPFDPFDKKIYSNNPNGYSFDTSYNYAPLQGIRGFLGLRYVLY